MRCLGLSRLAVWLFFGFGIVDTIQTAGAAGKTLSAVDLLCLSNAMGSPEIFVWGLRI